MITQVSGKLLEKTPTHVVIDCNGIGYIIQISLKIAVHFRKESYKAFCNLQNIDCIIFSGDPRPHTCHAIH